MIELEKYFTDDNWNEFSNIFNLSYIVGKEEILLREKISNNDKMSTIIYQIHGSESLNWIYSKVPALDNLRPIDCITNDNLKKRLKVCLMRMFK